MKITDYYDLNCPYKEFIIAKRHQFYNRPKLFIFRPYHTTVNITLTCRIKPILTLFFIVTTFFYFFSK